MIRVHNYRKGFATNSSSTHSIVIHDGKKLRSSPPYGTYMFGWEPFTLLTREEKLDYLVASVNMGLRKLPPKEAIREIESLTGVDVSGRDLDNIYVDHQSVLTFPSSYDGRRPVDPRFVEEFKTFLFREDVAILGGDDNGGAHPNRCDVSDLDFINRLQEAPGTRCRWDEKYKYFTLFNDRTGDKIRMTFEGKDYYSLVRNPREIVKARTPELVDIKITDSCGWGCPYCYQDSNEDGKHATITALRTIAETLSKMQVFEVAIGGGDPLDHPSFIKILQLFREHHIIPNFSTRSSAWLKSKNFVGKVLENIGAFAISVRGSDDVRVIRKLAEDAGAVDKLAFHYVLGTGDGIEEIVKAAAGMDYRQRAIPVTILWPKKVGRGASWEFHDEDLIQAIMNLRSWRTREGGGGIHYQIGADTTTISNFTDYQLGELGIDIRTYDRYEGKFSMYIDAVNGKVGPTSYEPKKLVDVPPMTEEGMVEYFGRW